MIRKLGEEIFTIIVLTYNKEALLYEGIDSILKQDYPCIQMIISDDASDSFDEGRIRSYIETNKKPNLKNYRIVANRINLGIAANCDAAFSYCTGEYVLFLDGDDVLANDSAITNIVRAFKTLPKEEMVVTGNALMCDENLENGELRRTKDELKKKNSMHPIEQFKELYVDFWPLPSATAYKKELFSRLGGFKIPENRNTQDCYYFLHLTRKGIKFNTIEYIVAKHRAGGLCYADPKSKESIGFREEMLKCAEREIFPYKDLFSMEELNKICARYYENLIGYILASNENYLISEPAYTLIKSWAERTGIYWCYNKSRRIYCCDYEGSSVKRAIAAIRNKVGLYNDTTH